MKVLGISGSLRVGSHSTSVLRTAAELTDMHLWTRLSDVPPFNEDHEAEAPAAVQAMRASVAEADAVLIVTPEYNATIPGQLKNALDWLSRPYGDCELTDKPVAVIGASPSDYGADWAQQDLRKVLGVVGADVAERHLCIPRADKAFDEYGQLRDAGQRATLALMLNDLSTMVSSRKVAVA